jgi:hypothetical protein
VTPGRWLDLAWPDDAFGSERGSIGAVSCSVLGRSTLRGMKETFMEVDSARAAQPKDAADLATLQALDL